MKFLEKKYGLLQAISDNEKLFRRCQIIPDNKLFNHLLTIEILFFFSCYFINHLIMFPAFVQKFLLFNLISYRKWQHTIIAKNNGHSIQFSQWLIVVELWIMFCVANMMINLRREWVGKQKKIEHKSMEY